MTTTFLRVLCVAAVLQTAAMAQSGWGQVITSGPQARTRHALAFDSQRGRTVLFGGASSVGVLGDTWEWNGISWSLMAVTGPPARFEHAMVYDSQRGRTVLFGGMSNSTLFGDTWEWDGLTWALVATTGPTAQRCHAMSYDSQRGRTVLFGGLAIGLAYTGDTWEWDGITWTRMAITGPPHRMQLALAYDRDRGRTVLFGGHRYSVDMNDTWEWDGSLWTPMGDVPPPGRRFHAMAFDTQRSRTVMFGGYGGVVFGDTWERGSGPVSSYATAAVYGNACGGPPLPLGLWPDPASRPVIGQTGRTTVANAPTSLVAVALGFRSQFAGTFQLSLAGIGMPGCELLQSGDVLGLGVLPLTSTTQSFELTIPNAAALFNGHAYLQAHAFAPGQNPLGVITSNGVDWRFGIL